MATIRPFLIQLCYYATVWAEPVKTNKELRFHTPSCGWWCASLCSSPHSPTDAHTGRLALACVSIRYGLKMKCLPQPFNAGQLPALLCAIGWDNDFPSLAFLCARLLTHFGVIACCFSIILFQRHILHLVWLTLIFVKECSSPVLSLSPTHAVLQNLLYCCFLYFYKPTSAAPSQHTDLM